MTDKDSVAACKICGGTGIMTEFTPTADVKPKHKPCYCQKPFEHIASVNCECGPQLIYTAPDGTGIYVHVAKQ